MDLMTPLRRRRKSSNLAEKARNLAVVQVAWAFLRDRIGSNLPPARKRGGGKKRLLLIGGAATGAAAAAGGLMKKRANSQNGQEETPAASTNGPAERTPTPAGTPHN
jgi:hypothetical protein